MSGPPGPPSAGAGGSYASAAATATATAPASGAGASPSDLNKIVGDFFSAWALYPVILDALVTPLIPGPSWSAPFLCSVSLLPTPPSLPHAPDHQPSISPSLSAFPPDGHFYMLCFA